MTPSPAVTIRPWPAKAFGKVLTFRSRGEKRSQRLAFFSLWLAFSISAAFFLLLILHAPLAVFLAFTAGFSVRWMEQRWLLRNVRQSAQITDLASFKFDGEQVLSTFNEAAILRRLRSWKLWALPAAAAMCVCFAALYGTFPEVDLLPERIQHVRWISASIGAGLPLLPVFVGISFFWIRGPERYWVGQVKAAIQSRAENAIDEVLAQGEIDGLQSGIEVLWERLGIERRGEYRAAIARHVVTQTNEVVLYPERSRALVNTIKELAQQDLRSLGFAVERVHQAECRLTAFQLLASEFRDPLQEIRAEELSAEFRHLSVLASHRRWNDLDRHASWAEGELDGLRSNLRRHAASVPAVMLPPGSDPYRLLGISADTPTPAIKKLRLRLAQLYHPDVSESISNSTKMAELNAAYDAVMKDREKECR